MKKTVAILMTLVMIVAMIPAAFAAKDVFTPSVGAKSTPDIVPPKGSDLPAGTVGTVVDDKGNVVENVLAENVKLISFDKNDTKNPEAQKILQESYNSISSSGLSSILGESGKDMVVTDLFYMSYEGDKLYSGNKLQLTLDAASVEAGKNVVVLTSSDGKTWEKVPAKNVLVNADGTLTVSLDKAGAVALAVGSTSQEPEEKNNTWLIVLIIVIAVVAVAAVVVVVVLKKKNAPAKKPEQTNKN